MLRVLSWDIEDFGVVFGFWGLILRVFSDLCGFWVLGAWGILGFLLVGCGFGLGLLVVWVVTLV